ncbi:nicotinate phosphoribosyltransferase [mine drainage metagenome]|uniref:Nicotinate phosphoribosyltransferase n=1 Tax=mine drainage metagenome TaxID=410659 RepID=T0ZIF5_9ZZZZ
MKFNVASESEVLSAENSDVYFQRSLSFLKNKKFNDDVIAEVTVSSFENPWINFTGLDDVLSLLEGRVTDLYAIPEGTVIPYRDIRGIPVPFISIRGNYRNFGMHETSLLGFICQSSGISSSSSMVKLAAGDKPVFSFGIRRMNPFIAPMIDRAAYIGGAEGVSGIKSGKMLGLDPVGTMPHAISLLLGDEEAWKAVAAGTKKGPVTVLIDTFEDEKFGALKAADLIPKLDFVRLDTPASRRGNFANIVREVRWELDLRGHEKVKIMVSGGLKEADILELSNAGADAFGVGTSIASGKTVDFAMDIVDVHNQPKTKKGKLSGAKHVHRCPDCGMVEVLPLARSRETCKCGGHFEDVLVPYIKNGKVIRREKPSEARARTINLLKRFYLRQEV